MPQKANSLIIFCLLSFALFEMAALAATSPAKKQSDGPLVNRSLTYGFPDEHPGSPETASKMPQAPLGGATATLSPGTIIGNTWYDCQHWGSMGRMVDWSLHGIPDTMIVHFSWMSMPGPIIFGRQYRYDNWNAATGNFGTDTGIGIQYQDEFAGFVGLDCTEDGRVVIGGHNREDYDGFSDCQFYWTSDPDSSDFSSQTQVPRNVSVYGGSPTQELMWPKFRYQEGYIDTALHILALEACVDAGDPQALYCFRKVGMDATGTWDYPPYIVDTVYTPAHDVAADNDGKVALVWTANLPCPGDPCDTCSGCECRSFSQMDNDLYYQISYDYGVSWQPRVNVTRNLDGEEGHRPYADLSALITSDGNLHIVWGARLWPADANSGGQVGLLKGCIFHWSEDNPYIRTVHNFEWDQTTCNGGVWELTASKMTVSECNGKLYVLFVQFNDLPNSVETDCATESSPSFPMGAANGDIYLTISSDWGMTWDKARNLTNSRTPGCDSTGGSPCDNDQWPSMARFGTTNDGDFGAAEIVIPTGSSDPGTYYLDIQYINDHSAGAVVQNEGFWAKADLRWFRLPCVEPVPNPQFSISPEKIGYPSWSQHGVPHDTEATITNDGNYLLIYTVTVKEDSGPAGWLSYSGFSGSVMSGLDNSETGTISLNSGGVVNDPGTTVNLVGRLIFESNAATSPDTFPIRHIVADTLYMPVWDTIHTTCLALTVANTGNFGHQGIGRVNLDYVDYGDCDNSAEVYLNDGSPIIGYVKGADTIVNFSIFNTTFADNNGFVPFGDHAPLTDSGDYEVFASGKFVTHDSLIAVEKTWYAPQSPDSCNFVIERFMIYLNRDTSVTGVRIGETIDWDIPSDSGSDNGSGSDPERNLIYQFGGEYNQDDSTECQDNDRRLGGMAFLNRFVNSEQESSPPHGAYTADNATFVYPNQGFVPEELYASMNDTGYTAYNSTHPDSQLVDLHTVMTFDTGLVLTPTDTHIYYVELVTIEDGTLSDLQSAVDMGRQWYLNHFTGGCCQNRGNVDGVIGIGGPVDVADLTYLVNYLFRFGPSPPCEEEGNIDNVTGIGGPIDVADLTYLVTFLFRGGNPPPPC